MLICGIDYSLTSPAISLVSVSSLISNDPPVLVASYALSTRKSVAALSKIHLPDKINPKIHIEPYPEYDTQARRLAFLAEWVSSKIPEQKEEEEILVVLEGYAYSRGKAGMIFNVGEAGGVLKHVLFMRNILPLSVTPTEVKNTATGSGRASKEEVIEAFHNAVGLGNLLEGYKQQASDIADSFFVALAGLKRKRKEQETGEKE